MGENILHIYKPYIEDRNGKTRLNAKILWQGKEQILWLEVEKEWGKYFVDELSDPFILAVLKKAMKYNANIEYEQPMSEDLKYSLQTYLIPVYSQNLKIFNQIQLIGDITDKTIPTEGHVATGFSAGVDSFYTVLKHLNTPYKKHNLTHLLLAVNGAANTGYSEKADKEWFEGCYNRFKPLAEEMGLKLIAVNSNVDLFYAGDMTLGGDVIVTSSFIHALRKLYSTYYWASADPANILKFDSFDAGGMEPLSTKYVSVNGLQYYHSGSETNRIGKVNFIGDFPIVQKGLTVCGNIHNCGRCNKCLRTMSELYAVGKLEKFKESFPVDDYIKNFSSRLAEELTIDYEQFIVDILAKFKENNVDVPMSVYLKKWFFYKPLYFIKSKLRKNKYLLKIYYEHRLYEKIFGLKIDEELVKARLEGKEK